MNASAPSSAEPSLFFGRFLTKCRKSAPGLLGLGLVVAATATGRWQLASLAAARGTKVAEVPPVSVRALALQEEVVTTGLRYSAIVKELQKVELSFRVPGTVESLHQVEGPGGVLRNVHEGDVLPKGTVVARLDPGDYERDRRKAAERLASAQARLAEAKSNHELAEIDYRRAERLVQRNSMTVSELDSARNKRRNAIAAESAALAEVAAAGVELEQADANLKYCTLAVPFAESTVAARSIEKNERVAANQRTFLVIDVSSVVIAFTIPDTLVGRLSIGQAVDVGTDALPDEHFTGVIHKIASMADSRTRTYPIEVRVDRPRGLRPGMVANVHFRHESKAHLLPLTSVGPDDSGKSYVVYRLVERDGHPAVQRVPIEVEGVMDNRIAVRLGTSGGLAPGDRVIATGIHRLHDGEPVQVVE